MDELLNILSSGSGHEPMSYLESELKRWYSEIPENLRKKVWSAYLRNTKENDDYLRDGELDFMKTLFNAKIAAKSNVYRLGNIDFSNEGSYEGVFPEDATVGDVEDYQEGKTKVIYRNDDNRGTYEVCKLPSGEYMFAFPDAELFIKTRPGVVIKEGKSNSTSQLMEHLEKLTGSKIILKEVKVKPTNSTVLDNLKNLFKVKKGENLNLNQYSIYESTSEQLDILLGDYGDPETNSYGESIAGVLEDIPGYELGYAMGDDIPNSLTIHKDADLNYLFDNKTEDGDVVIDCIINVADLCTESGEYNPGNEDDLEEGTILSERVGDDDFLTYLQNETGVIFNEAAIDYPISTEVTLLLGNYNDTSHIDQIENLQADLDGKPGYEFETEMGDDIPKALKITSEADLSFLTGYTLAQLKEVTDSCTADEYPEEPLDEYDEDLNPLSENEEFDFDKGYSDEEESLDNEISREQLKELVYDIIPTLDDDEEAEIYVLRYGLKIQGDDDIVSVSDDYQNEGTGKGYKEALEDYAESFKYNDED